MIEATQIPKPHVTVDELREASPYFTLALGLLRGPMRAAAETFGRFAQQAIERADAEAAAEDRVDRGMLESLCDGCKAEIPEGTDYAVDSESDFTWCPTCKAELVAEWEREGAKLDPSSIAWHEHFGAEVDLTEHPGVGETIVTLHDGGTLRAFVVPSARIKDAREAWAARPIPGPHVLHPAAVPASPRQAIIREQDPTRNRAPVE
jgi:hypothetical protein